MSGFLKEMLPWVLQLSKLKGCPLSRGCSDQTSDPERRLSKPPSRSDLLLSGRFCSNMHFGSLVIWTMRLS
jgi:hypothetical protein